MRARSSRQPTQADLAALADGSLAPARRAQVERAVAESTELQAELREQRVALTAVQAAATVRAPAHLRERAAPAQPARRRTRRLGGVAIAATAAMVAALVLLIGSGPSAAPTVADAAVLATRPAVTAVPIPARGAATLAAPRGAGLPFPNWAEYFGWHAVGARRDRIAGRPATTVFYRRGAQTIAYTIVGGAPLRVGAPARTWLRGGTEFRAIRVGRRYVVTWQRRGRTCVLSGTTSRGGALLRLAGWRAGGKIPY